MFIIYIIATWHWKKWSVPSLLRGQTRCFLLSSVARTTSGWWAARGDDKNDKNDMWFFLRDGSYLSTSGWLWYVYMNIFVYIQHTHTCIYVYIYISTYHSCTYVICALCMFYMWFFMQMYSDSCSLHTSMRTIFVFLSLSSSLYIYIYIYLYLFHIYKW